MADKAPDNKAPEAPKDPFLNPVLVNEPGTTRSITPVDESTNPAARGPEIGAGGPHPEPGVVQTTIDTDKTTINPDSSINNPIKPDGSPAPLKNAELGKLTPQTSDKAVAADKADKATTTTANKDVKK